MSPGFQGEQLAIRLVKPGSKLLVCLEDLVYVDAAGRRFTVPAGTITDLASVPKVVRSFALFWTWTAPAGVLHDGLYRWHEHWEIPRRESDALYYEALIDVGAPGWRAWGQWSTLRATGWSSWNSWREKQSIDPGEPPPPIAVP